MVISIDLDAKCGKYLTFRDVVECGETWAERARSAHPIRNRPTRLETIKALERLCHLVLDPVIEEFGSIEITYGFSGLELSNQVKRTVGGVAPALDQHAACEHSSIGTAICPRGGAAADFRVQRKSSIEVARWIVANTNFDRLYYYGDDRPIHVSISTEPIGEIVIMNRGPSGRRIPVVTPRDQFIERDLTCPPKTGPRRMSLLPLREEKPCVGTNTAWSRSSRS